MKLTKPLDNCYITQPFGVDWVGNNFYKGLGLKGHNGIDFSAYNGTPCYSVFNGVVNDVWEDEFGGKQITIISEDGKFEAVYAHMQEITVKGGDRLAAGQQIGKTDSSGKWCFGAHLHFGLKPIPKNYNNGYNGAIDPLPFFGENFDKLPVDLRYGKPRNWLAEWLMTWAPEQYIKQGNAFAIAGHWIHTQLLKSKRKLPLDGQHINALVYGNWDFHFVMDDSMFGIWSQLTKAEWKAGKLPPFKMSAGATGAEK